MKTTENFLSHVNSIAELGIVEVLDRTLTLKTSDYPVGLVLHADPEKSQLTPFLANVPDVDTLKALTGLGHISANNESAGRELPAPLEAGAKVPARAFHPDVCSALFAYVYGNSSAVATWKDTLNRLRFPMQLSVFAAKSITVTAGKPLILQGDGDHPIALICDEIIVEQDGQIISECPGKVSVAKLSAIGSAGQPIPTLVSRGGDGGGGGRGGNGAEGGKGARGANATTSGKSGCHDAGNGGEGGNGTNGSPGGPGGKGGDANDINFSIDTLEGNILVGSIGGNGGNGGDAGDGGTGGAGGDGGDSCRNCGRGQNGKGGKGGDGGSGGDGGHGGGGARVFINYLHGSPTITVSDLTAKGGNSGSGGEAGKGGSGSPGGNPGNAGNAGKPGNGGQPGVVIINGNKYSG